MKLKKKSPPKKSPAPAPAKSPVIYVNGEFLPRERATISVFDHGFLYGDGVFEGIRAYNGRVFRLKEHLDRLYKSARAIILDVPLLPADLRDAVLETLRRNNLRDGYVRLVVSRGPGDLGLDPRNCPKPTVVIIAQKIVLYPEECYVNGLEVATVSTRRNSPQALNPNIKSLNYLNNILAKIEANLVNVREAIFLNLEGYVAECTADNIFYIKGKDIITPPTSAGALDGITRRCAMELAAAQGLNVVEKLFTPYDLFISDEAFLTGTAAEIVPVVRIDSRPIADGKPGPHTRRLVKAFRDLTAREGVPI